MTREVRIHELLGREVRDARGEGVGRLHEVRAEQQGNEFVVTEYFIGVRGLAERLGVEAWRTHAGGASRGYVVRWDQMDLADPAHPRLHCLVAELKRWP